MPHSYTLDKDAAAIRNGFETMHKHVADVNVTTPKWSEATGHANGR